MDILRTGAIECRHAPGECKACSVRLEQRCRASQQEPNLDDCTCPQREALVMDAWSGAGHRVQHAVYSHDCPVHGADIDGRRDPRHEPLTGFYACPGCGLYDIEPKPDVARVLCPRCKTVCKKTREA